MKINTLGELEEFIREFRMWDSQDGYDFGAVVSLLLSSLDNLRKFGLESEIEDIGDYMSLEQIDFLHRIAAYAKQNVSKED